MGRIFKKKIAYLFSIYNFQLFPVNSAVSFKHFS